MSHERSTKWRVGINGFGRIGRAFFRAAAGCEDIEVVAINDLSDYATRLHLLRFDSLRGRLKYDVTLEKGNLLFEGRPIQLFTEAFPEHIPWDKAGVDFVLESTGRFVDQGHKHLRNGVKKVVISAPANEVDGVFVMGLNEDMYDPRRHHVISNASCTVNCFGMLIKLLDDTFGLESCLITNVHSISNQQGTQDADRKDLRLGRAAGYNMVPHHPGAAATFARVMPEFAGRVQDYTVRVPLPIGSLNDLSVRLRRPVTVQEVNDAMLQASHYGRFAPYLEYTDDPIVSTDIISSPASCIFDAGLTQVIGQHVRVVGWHDQEAGYTNRLIDLITYIGKEQSKIRQYDTDRTKAAIGARQIPALKP
jgi:glyceraldehyde 3-phosphate dehydrogenase